MNFKKIIKNKGTLIGFSFLAGVILLVGLFYSGQKTDKFIGVEKVIDGDTIVLKNGETVRYLGIDSPELYHSESEAECGAEEAKKINEKLLIGKKVKLEKDITDKDKYGRLLRFVYTEDGDFVNYSLVSQGYAKLLFIPPDAKFKKDFTEAQEAAKRENVGLWKTCYK